MKQIILPMMGFSSFVLLFSLCNGFLNNNDKPYGKQTIHFFSGEKRSIPDEVILYYGNNLIEQVTKVHFTTLNHTLQSEIYDTSYCLINLEKGLCVYYKKFSIGADHGKLLKLEDKRFGLSIDQPMDSTLDYSPNLPLQDSVIDGIKYKYINVHTRSGPNQLVTLYFTFNNKPPFHINKQIDKDYKGTLTRMDITDTNTNETMSISMTIEPNKLTSTELSVFKYWLKQNNWE